jgi:hypothetical protein
LRWDTTPDKRIRGRSHARIDTQTSFYAGARHGLAGIKERVAASATLPQHAVRHGVQETAMLGESLGDACRHGSPSSQGFQRGRPAWSAIRVMWWVK